VLGTDARTFDLENGVMERVASTTTPQPVIAIAERRSSGLAAVKNAQWVVIADRISDPGNLGTILRSAEAAGVSAVVLTPGTVEAFNPKVVRASAGAMFHVPIIEDVSVEEIRDNGFKVFGTSSHDQQGSFDFTTADLTGKIALLVGNEAWTTTPRWMPGSLFRIGAGARALTLQWHALSFVSKPLGSAKAIVSPISIGRATSVNS
jgi:TrmH family RNA methyltransferase